MSYGQSYASDVFAIQAAESERAAFLRRTYIHLFGAILAFMGIEAAIFNFVDVPRLLAPLAGSGWVGGIVMMIAFIAASSIARAWANNAASPALQYLGLGLYTVAQALIFVPLLYVATLIDKNGGNVIPMAGVITLLTFGGLTAFVMASGANFSFLGGTLVVCTWSALVIMIVAAFAGFNLGLLFCGAMILLSAGWILYDTSNVLHHYRTDQHVGAALELFASVALLFWYVLQFVIEMQSSRD